MSTTRRSGRRSSGEGVRTKNEIHFTGADQMMAIVAQAYATDPARLEKLRTILSQ